MAGIIWSADMNLGIQELDNLRLSLVEIVNQMEQALECDVSNEETSGMLRRFASVLREYINLERRHFMLYESFNAARDKREDAIEQITCEIIAGLVNYLDGGKAVDWELLNKIKTWLQFHLTATKSIKPGNFTAVQNLAAEPDHT